MEDAWYIPTGRMPVGPLSFEMLAARARDGSISPSTIVYKGMGGAWIPASQVPGIVFESPEPFVTHASKAEAKPAAIEVSTESPPRDPSPQAESHLVPLAVSQASICEEGWEWGSTECTEGRLTLPLDVQQTTPEGGNLQGDEGNQPVRFVFQAKKHWKKLLDSMARTVFAPVLAVNWAIVFDRIMVGGILVGAVVGVPALLVILLGLIGDDPPTTVPPTMSPPSRYTEVMSESMRRGVTNEMIKRGADPVEADAFTRALNDAQREWEAKNR